MDSGPLKSQNKLYSLIELNFLIAQGLEENDTSRLVVTALSYLLEVPFTAVGLQEDRSTNWVVSGQWEKHPLDAAMSQQLASLLAMELAEVAFSAVNFPLLADLPSAAAKIPEPVANLGVRSLLLVPIRTVNHKLGVIIVGSEVAQDYTPYQRLLISSVANQMAIALGNARLYKESRESEMFSASLLANSPNPITVINSDTSIRYANPALEKLTGFSSTELMGRKAPYPWWSEETLEKIGEDFKEAMRVGVKRFEELFQKKNGERLWVEITSTSIIAPGGEKCHLSNWVDITERKQAEEKEKKLQRELHLTSRLASIGELAAGVAHEINNPLTGIIGFSQRLLRKSTDEKLSRDLEVIYNEAQRAAKVVQNLLTFARRRQPKKEYSDINDIMQKSLELRGYELKTGNIEVVTDLASTLPKTSVDFHQIQEVFLNIILNAEQAMTEAHGGGKLAIKTEGIKGRIRISFADDGPGIAAEHVDKLFDPFFTLRAEKGGTGLGLGICHGIVTEHGGRIYVKTKVGKGATFFVELPVIAE